jgi:hypothetical protein
MVAGMVVLTFGFIVIGCEMPTNKDPEPQETKTSTYTGTAGGKNCELEIDNGFYTLLFDDKLSTGTVVSGPSATGAYILHPSTPGASQFTVRTSAGGITGMGGNIIFNGEATVTILPSDVVPTGTSNGPNNNDKESGGKTGGGTKPAKLATTATYDQTIATLDEIIAYSDTSEDIKTSAQSLKSQLPTLKPNWAYTATVYVGMVNAMIDTIPDDSKEDDDTVPGGETGGKTGSGTKPAKLATTATYDQTIATLDEIIAYSGTSEDTKTSAQSLKSQLPTFKPNWSYTATVYVGMVNVMIDTIPDDSNSGSPDQLGTITITPAGGTVGTQLFAVYEGNGNVSYQWKKDGTAIYGETGTVYKATEAGNYTVTVSATGYQSKTSAAVTVSGAAPDTTAPEEVTRLSAVSGNGTVTLSWTPPLNGDFAGVEISFSDGNYTGGAVTVAKGTNTTTITDLTNGVAHTFTVKAVDTSVNKSAGVTVSATPVSPIQTALAGKTGSGTEANPYVITVAGMDLSTELGAIYSGITDGYISLDLSACTGTSVAYTNSSNHDKFVSIILPASVTTLTRGSYSDQGAFCDFTNLKSISAPGVTTVGDSTFEGCTSLTSVNLPAATTFGNETFSGCTSLTSVSFPAATSFGYGTFSGCTSLSSVSLPAATSFGNGTFSGCTSLTSVTLGITTVDSSMFADVRTSLTSVSLPKATTFGATTFGDRTFSDCTSLTSVSLPEAITFGNGTFSGCTSLTSVTLPKAETFGDYTFRRCASLSSVTLGATPPTMGGSTLDNTGTTALTIKVPSRSVDAYTAWKTNLDASYGKTVTISAL